MSAGNSFNEAVVQGICEIFERFALKKIFFGYDKCPNFSRSVLSSLGVLEYIEEIESEGYVVCIKDCSIDGEVPVIASLIFNKDFTFYKAAFGSDIYIRTAIMRCLTELFQGYDMATMEENLIKINEENEKDYGLNFIRFYTNGTGPLPNEFLEFDKEIKYIPDVFSTSDEGNTVKLDKIVNHLKIKGYDLYIRDNSILGFPAYFSYIPQLSHLNDINNDILDVIASIDKMYNVVLKEKNANLDDMKYVLENFKTAVKYAPFRYLFNERYNSKFFFSCLKHYNAKSTEFDSWFVMARIAHYLGDYRFVSKALREVSVQRGLSGDQNMNLYISFFDLKSCGCSYELISELLNEQYGDIEEIISVLNDDSLAFDDMQYPKCPDCSECSFTNDCKYNEWKRVIEQMNFKSTVIDQASLSDYFSLISN